MYKSLRNIKYLDSGCLQPQKIMMLFHGFGADAQDLFPLHQFLPASIQYVFPEGLLEIPLSPWQVGRAWFPIDFTELEAAIREGNMQRLKNRYREPLENVARQLKAFVLQGIAENQPPLILGGFSQGGMLAMQLACDTDIQQRLKGLVLLSTNPSNYEEWHKNMSNIQCPVFISHGRQDPVLPFQFAELMAKDFAETNKNVEFHSFSGGHEIPLPILQSLKDFLNKKVT